MTQKDEQIGFHKGAVSTLGSEKRELIIMLTNVEKLIQLHLKALKDLGVDLEKEAQNAKKEGLKGKL